MPGASIAQIVGALAHKLQPSRVKAASQKHRRENDIIHTIEEFSAVLTQIAGHLDPLCCGATSSVTGAGQRCSGSSRCAVQEITFRASELLHQLHKILLGLDVQGFSCLASPARRCLQLVSGVLLQCDVLHRQDLQTADAATFKQLQAQHSRMIISSKILPAFSSVFVALYEDSVITSMSSSTAGSCSFRMREFTASHFIAAVLSPALASPELQSSGTMAELCKQLQDNDTWSMLSSDLRDRVLPQMLLLGLQDSDASLVEFTPGVLLPSRPDILQQAATTTAALLHLTLQHKHVAPKMLYPLSEMLQQAATALCKYTTSGSVGIPPQVTTIVGNVVLTLKTVWDQDSQKMPTKRQLHSQHWPIILQAAISALQASSQCAVRTQHSTNTTPAGVIGFVRDQVMQQDIILDLVRGILATRTSQEVQLAMTMMPAATVVPALETIIRARGNANGGITVACQAISLAQKIWQYHVAAPYHHDLGYSDVMPISMGSDGQRATQAAAASLMATVAKLLTYMRTHLLPCNPEQHFMESLQLLQSCCTVPGHAATCSGASPQASQPATRSSDSDTSSPCSTPASPHRLQSSPYANSAVSKKLWDTPPPSPDVGASDQSMGSGSSTPAHEQSSAGTPTSCSTPVLGSIPGYSLAGIWFRHVPPLVALTRATLAAAHRVADPVQPSCHAGRQATTALDACAGIITSVLYHLCTGPCMAEISSWTLDLWSSSGLASLLQDVVLLLLGRYKVGQGMQAVSCQLPSAQLSADMSAALLDAFVAVITSVDVLIRAPCHGLCVTGRLASIRFQLVAQLSSSGLLLSLTQLVMRPGVSRQYPVLTSICLKHWPSLAMDTAISMQQPSSTTPPSSSLGMSHVSGSVPPWGSDDDSSELAISCLEELQHTYDLWTTVSGCHGFPPSLQPAGQPITPSSGGCSTSSQQPAAFPETSASITVQARALSTLCNAARNTLLQAAQQQEQSQFPRAHKPMSSWDILVANASICGTSSAGFAADRQPCSPGLQQGGDCESRLTGNFPLSATSCHSALKQWPGCFNPGCINLKGGQEAILPLHLCAGCRAVGYCSKSCQVSAWPSHKTVCSHLKKNRQNKGVEE